MSSGYDPRLLLPDDPDAAEAHTWRVLLSLPGRVGMVDPGRSADLMRAARASVAEVDAL